jgi:hypothetical protein
MLSLNELSESVLSFAEIIRPDREYRADLFIKKMKMGEPFELTSGDKVVIQYSADIEKAIRTGNKKGLSTKPLVTADGEEFGFGKLKKSQEFGGGTRGSGGGADQTRATESAQCVYAQVIWDNPNTKFSPDDLKAAYAKVNSDAKIDEILLSDDGWIASSINGARLLHKALKRKEYTWHRGSSWVDALENKFKELNRQEKIFKNVNKWTPADIWAVARGAENEYNILNASSISELNKELLKAYAERDIIGISLKKIGKKPKLVQVNYKKPFKAPKFTTKTYGKREFFAAKDGYLYFAGKGQIQFRTFPTFQCEIVATKAKHGKVSYGGISEAMKLAVGRPLTDKKVIERLFKSSPDKFYTQFYQNYSMSNNPKMTKEQFIKKLEGKQVDWLMSKYMVTELFTAIEGREQQVIEYLYRIAKSQTKDSAVHLKVM